MKFQGWESDAYRAGVLWVRAVVETARRLKREHEYIIKRIDERVDELDPYISLKVSQNRGK